MDISSLPSLSKDFLESLSTDIACYQQGYLLVDTDLNIVFYDSQGRNYSPYSIFYRIGFITEVDGLFHCMGSPQRVPIEIRTGRFRPNFQVGDKWNTGNYEIQWHYQVNGGDPFLIKKIPFIVFTKGIYDFTATAPSFLDISATVVVIP